ncbi:uncharacterized protein PAC_04347 [Phialocephala subalpina]|uniref:Uncharacterized protein n=1 Tax=Phialocephala subalpina TaxID=576137 RepID=A0A1L7WNW8_9HELO|nr:uncharacterized protein PAC_04347 [Phialocephala subalpina]
MPFMRVDGGSVLAPDEPDDPDPAEAEVQRPQNAPTPLAGNKPSNLPNLNLATGKKRAGALTHQLDNVCKGKKEGKKEEEDKSSLRINVESDLGLEVNLTANLFFGCVLQERRWTRK